MMKQFDTKASYVAVGALALFFIGGILTTIFPTLIEDSWATPVKEKDQYTEAQKRGAEIYNREGCWYCHTQQVRTLVPDTKRYGWRGVDAPISTPGEYVREETHMLGTRRIGPDLGRVGGKYDTSWHKTHFHNPADLVPGSVMPPFPWILEHNDGQDFEDLVDYLQTRGRTIEWRPDDDYER